jgi:ubiquinone/menaquinone biosynthesis C-methylase UbiE
VSTIELTAATRFSGLAVGYDRHRPDYPAALLAAIATAPAPSVPRLALDVGAGTGIAARLIAANLPADWRVAGVEPNADMRAQAAAREGEGSRIAYVDAPAEALPFKTAAAGLITVAQAIHWFDRPKFYAEAGRVLAPGGALCILYNDRDLTGPELLGEFETLMEREIPPYDRHYRQSDGAEDAQDRELDALEWTLGVTRHRCRHGKVLSPADFAGLMLSRSKLKPYTEKYGADEARRRLEALAAHHADEDGRVAVGMTARAHIAIRK